MGYVDDILKIVLAELHQTETSDWSMYPGGAPGAPARMYGMFCKCREDREGQIASHAPEINRLHLGARLVGRAKQTAM
jgi:hypothetical protein